MKNIFKVTVLACLMATSTLAVAASGNVKVSGKVLKGA